MRTFFLALLVALLVAMLLPVTVFGQNAPCNNDAVIRSMTYIKKQPNVFTVAQLIDLINSNPSCKFDLSDMRLKAANVPDNVLEAMRAKSPIASPAPTVAAVEAQPAAEQSLSTISTDGNLAVVSNNKMLASFSAETPLLPNPDLGFTSHFKRFGKGVKNLGKNSSIDVFVEMLGESSINKVSSPDVSFLYTGNAPAMHLLRVRKVNSDRRVLYATDFQDNTKIDLGKKVESTMSREGLTVRLTPNTPLDEGEYVIVIPGVQNTVFTFSVTGKNISAR